MEVYSLSFNVIYVCDMQFTVVDCSCKLVKVGYFKYFFDYVSTFKVKISSRQD